MAIRNTVGRRLLSDADLEAYNPFDEVINNFEESFNATPAIDSNTKQNLVNQLLANWQGLGTEVGIGSSGTENAEIGGRSLSVVANDFAQRLLDQGITDLSQAKFEPGKQAAWTAEGKGNVSLMATQDGRLIPVWGSSSDASKARNIALTVGSMFVAPGLAGALGGGLGGFAGAGAILGGTKAAITGDDILRGAVLGGLGGAAGYGIGNLFGGPSAGIGGAQGAEFADMAAGLSPEFGTTAAYDAAIAAGAPTMLSSAPLTTSLASPLEELTSGGLVTDTGAPALLSEQAISVLPPISETVPTLAEVAATPDVQRIEITGTAPRQQTIGDVAADVNAGALYGPLMTGAQTAKYDEVLEKTGSKEEADKATGAVGEFSLKDLYTALQALGALSSTGLFGGGGGGTQQRSFVAPTATVPMGNADYYNAVQQYYNTYMPQTPRDVATSLQQWYEGKFGG